MKPLQPPTTINEAITCWGTGAGGAAVVLRVQRASEGLATALPGPHPLLHRRSGYLSRGGMRLPAAAIPSSPPGSGPPPPPLGLGSPRWTRAPCTDPLARTRLPGPPRLVGSPLMLTISPPPPPLGSFGQASHVPWPRYRAGTGALPPAHKPRAAPRAPTSALPPTPGTRCWRAQPCAHPRSAHAPAASPPPPPLPAACTCKHTVHMHRDHPPAAPHRPHAAFQL